MTATAKTYKGKSTKLGYGGRAAKLKDQLMAKKLPGGAREAGAIVGKIARMKGAAPGQKNYHGKSRGR